jgi:hypothetical protein
MTRGWQSLAARYGGGDHPGGGSYSGGRFAIWFSPSMMICGSKHRAIRPGELPRTLQQIVDRICLPAALGRMYAGRGLY